MTQKELLKKIGSVEQIGGIHDFTYNDGKMKGVRVIEINTGKIRFRILPDRGMDIAQAEFEGTSFSWISKTGITAPQYYEKDGSNWLRGFYGGLMTTCGLKNVDFAYGDHGLHGRIANTPASKISVFADWIEDDYVMKVSGEMRECTALGFNLVLKRVITAKLFESKFTVEDTVINEGFKDEGVALCYHCNFGYPLVDEGSRLVNVPNEIADVSAPINGKKNEGIHVPYDTDVQTVGVENGTFGAYITYKRDTLPGFLVWKMMGEGAYAVGFEPRTFFGPAKKEENDDWLVNLKPFEKLSTQLIFELKRL